MKTAVNIYYKLWRKYIHELYQKDWKVVEKYCAYDASIDFDFIILRKNRITIKFGWELWNNGEIKTNSKGFEILNSIHDNQFEFGKPKVLNFKTMLITRPVTIFTRLSVNKRKLMDNFFYFTENKI
ncbi:hypothetical protein Q2T41_01840 [Maribacter confluentis]|uniref:Uncharacterized protein n=1 Tax=Maribacter confluentis TaxID=1656093 RepID=A0ABT8RK81_9FLAO|nr:hypothetical protein [Maribacter confluentis]MDO1511405.1 hypothetical protein [Maribacter confluentis]